MKLINKKTGEIAIFGKGIVDLNQIGCKNVAEMMMAGWEDYEEPKTPHIKLVIEAEMDVPDSPYDLDLLFGGEE